MRASTASRRPRQDKGQAPNIGALISRIGVPFKGYLLKGSIGALRIRIGVPSKGVYIRVALRDTIRVL